MTEPDLVHVTLPWTDDLILHAQRLTRWLTDYVDLEESLAVGSIVQEELSHARALLELAGCSIEERDWRVFVRPPEEWFPAALVVAPADDWPDVVARGFLFARASLVVVQVLWEWGGSRVSPTASVAFAEQELHARHWARWAEILFRDSVTSDRMVRALGEAAQHCGDLFGLPAAPVAGYDPAALHRQWTDCVTRDLAVFNGPVLDLPITVTPRRAGGPDVYLTALLDGIRVVRDSHPDRVYGIYR